MAAVVPRMGRLPCIPFAGMRFGPCADYAGNTRNPPMFFVSERGGSMATLGFNKLIQRLGKAAAI
jgi:hypothetical protein